MLALIRLASGQYARILVGIAASPILARSLGPSGRGIWALVVSFDIASTLLLGTGYAQAFSYFYRNAKDDREKKTAIGSAVAGLRVVVVRSWVAAPIALIIAWQFFEPTIAVTIAMLVLATPSTLFNAMTRQLAGLERRDTLYAVIDGAPAIMQALIIVVLAAFSQLTLLTGFAALVGVRFLSFLPGVRLWPTFRGGVVSREFTSYGVRALPATLAQLAQGRVSELALVPLGTAAIGQFAVASTLSGLLNPLYIATNTRIFRSKSEEVPTLRQATKRLVPLIPIAFAVGIAGYFLLVPVYGQEYEAGREVALWLSIGSLGFGLFLICRALLDRLGRPGLASAIQVGHVVAVFAIVPPVVLSQGLVAAAIVISALQFARGFVGLFSYWMVRRSLSGTNTDS